MKLTILGTGNAGVTSCFNTCFVLSQGSKHMLVDGGGGNGLFQQLQKARLKWQDLRTIFVTHKHLDHILGIVWLIRFICQGLNRGQYAGEAAIYGSKEVIRTLQTLSAQLFTPQETRHIGSSLHLVEVTDGQCLRLIEHQIQFFDIHSNKAEQFGFSMELEQGSHLTCCGDEPFNESERKYAQNSKWLLHEAFCLDSQSDIFKPHQKHHSTVKEACQLAENLKVENLILYHTEDRNITNRKSLYLAEGEQYFSGRLFVPNDLECFELN
ncbi:MAG: MBL fold metallo-hydrolase [Candidatus Bruticola sp.]